jgi:hypothetical protein
MGNDRPQHEADEKLGALFDSFEGHLVSPGGAAALLGVSRKTVHMLGKRGEIRVYSSDQEDQWGPFKAGPRWIYVPLEDVYDYAERTGRGTDALRRWPDWLKAKREVDR